jgi:membrane protein implicated in regulation of membrane protease activity
MQLIPHSLSILWLIALIVFALAEAATPTALVTIWFAIGSLVSLILSFFVRNLGVQLVVFLVVSCLCFALVRPLARKYFTPKTTATNADALIGQEALVTEAIDNLSGKGQVKLRGTVWSARSEDDAPIEATTKVTVLRIEGVKLIVRPIQ